MTKTEKQGAVTVKVAPNKIGAIIGSGGRTIKRITEETKTQIDIEQDGQVKIFGGGDVDIERAIRWVKTLAGQIDKGDIYEGTVRKTVEFGMFVELVPGLDGLVHVSNLPAEKKETFSRDYHVGDSVTVQVLDYDSARGRVSLSLVPNS